MKFIKKIVWAGCMIVTSLSVGYCLPTESEEFPKKNFQGTQLLDYEPIQPLQQQRITDDPLHKSNLIKILSLVIITCSLYDSSLFANNGDTLNEKDILAMFYVGGGLLYLAFKLSKAFHKPNIY